MLHRFVVQQVPVVRLVRRTYNHKQTVFRQEVFPFFLLATTSTSNSRIAIRKRGVHATLTNHSCRKSPFLQVKMAIAIVI
jgi:hypothetical protein